MIESIDSALAFRGQRSNETMAGALAATVPIGAIGYRAGQLEISKKARNRIFPHLFDFHQI
jgi:hypothetical protein